MEKFRDDSEDRDLEFGEVSYVEHEVVLEGAELRVQDAREDKKQHG